MIINTRSDLDELKGTDIYGEALRQILGATTMWVNDAPAGSAPQWHQVSVGDTLARLDLTLDELTAECAAAGIVPQSPSAPVTTSIAPPPETIRAAYLKAALAQIDKLTAVDAAVTDPVLKTLWASATEIRRDDPDVAAVAAALAIDLNDLWARARTIRAARNSA